MQKWFITSGIAIFILVTICVLTIDDSSQRKKIQFTNQNFTLKNDNTDIKNENVDIKVNQSKLSNTDVSATNKNINLDANNIKFQNQNSTTQNTDFSNTGNRFSNNSIKYTTNDFKNQNSKLNKQLADYENQKNKMRDIENGLNNTHYTPKPIKKDFQPVQRNRYIVKNIDWNTWKSNFINQIIDDSMYIHSLDDYELGSWFYYSFNVDKYGRISNITIRSMQLSPMDKGRIRKLIKSYEYQDITVFPANTQKTMAKVDAVVMLGNSEKKSRPSDFNENEQIKIKLPY